MTKAQEELYHQVYLPAFVKAAADLGVVLPDQDSLQEALETTALLHQLMAGQAQNTVKRASHSLKAALGIDQQQKQAQLTAAAQQEAAKLAQQPGLRQAVLQAEIE